jgi:hypothetical protein
MRLGGLTVTESYNLSHEGAEAMNLMLQFHHAGGKPTLEQVYELFGLAAGDLDEGYGVVATDPNAGVYVMLIRPHAIEKARTRLAQRPKHPLEGIFGNPRIEPTGPRSE